MSGRGDGRARFLEHVGRVVEGGQALEAFREFGQQPAFARSDFEHPGLAFEAEAGNDVVQVFGVLVAGDDQPLLFAELVGVAAEELQGRTARGSCCICRILRFCEVEMGSVSTASRIWRRLSAKST